jgi:RNA recognition motif-containing protein
MGKKLYVGNLSYNTTEESLKTYFSNYGTVASSKVIFDRETGNSKGFGFIEMGADEEAAAAIEGTNGKDFEGRQIRVNEAMDKPRSEGRGGRGGGGYGNNSW